MEIYKEILFLKIVTLKGLFLSYCISVFQNHVIMDDDLWDEVDEDYG